MNKHKVYIETSVISYLVSKPSGDLIIAANQKITADWWEQVCPLIDCFISEFVLQEIRRGDKIASKNRLAAVEDFKILETNDEITSLAKNYISLLNIPEKSSLDAFHLAIAVWYNVDFVLSWNCKHIANALVNRKLSQYNIQRDLNTPFLCTPNELMEV